MSYFTLAGSQFHETYQGWYATGPNAAHELNQGDTGPIKNSPVFSWDWYYADPIHGFAPADAADTVLTFTALADSGFHWYFVPPYSSAVRVTGLQSSHWIEPISELSNVSFAAVVGAITSSRRYDINWPYSYGSPPAGKGSWPSLYDVLGWGYTSPRNEADILIEDMMSRHPGGPMLVFVSVNGTGSMSSYYGNMAMDTNLQYFFTRLSSLAAVQWVYIKFSEWSIATSSPTYDFNGNLIYIGGDGWNYGGGENIPVTHPPIRNTTATPDSSDWFSYATWNAYNTGNGGDDAEADLEALRYAIGWSKAHPAGWGSKHIIHISDTQSKFPYGVGGFPTTTTIGEAGLRLFQRGDDSGLLNAPRLLKTETGNNPGSLQANPAPRLRETGNVHL